MGQGLSQEGLQSYLLLNIISSVNSVTAVLCVAGAALLSILDQREKIKALRTVLFGRSGNFKFASLGNFLVGIG